MSVTDNSEERFSIVQLNAELKNTELELMSAHCAVYKLRLRFSTGELARHGHRDVLRKSIETANSINAYFSSLEKEIHMGEPAPAVRGGLTEAKILQGVECVARYLDDQRNHYLPLATPLSKAHKDIMRPYFPADLLEDVRMLDLRGARLSNPPFYPQARELGFMNLPDIAHMNSMTFRDVLVFNEQVTERFLFHALVHAVQFQVLGIERYTELFVRSFINARFHFLVPLEAHAFLLESKFARPTPESFSVEEQVRLWAKQNRY